MKNALTGTYYEQRLQREIEEINEKIRELTAEQHALRRQLVKARQESAGLSDVNRKNSVNRVMIERRLVTALESTPVMSNSELFEQAKLVTFDLNPNTFRTHLYRLKNKGIIEPAEAPGRWKLQRPGNVFD